MGKSLKGKELGKGISQRKDGLFIARKMVNGKTVMLSNKSLTGLRREFKMAVENASSAMDCSTTFNAWYEKWFENIKKPRMKCDLSARKFKQDYDRTYPKIIGKKKMGEIRQIDIQEATNQMLESGTGYASVSLALTATNQIFKHAIANGIVHINPCYNVQVDQKYEKKRESHALEDWVIDLFFEALKGYTGYEMFKFMLLSGVRSGELAALRWSDIDFDRKIIEIKRTTICGYGNGRMEYDFVPPKTESGIREIPFIGGMEELLNVWREKRMKIHKSLIEKNAERYVEEYHDLVFVTKYDGNPYNRNSYKWMIERNKARMQKIENQRAKADGRSPREIPDVRTHLFRHTFATRCFEAGLSPNVVQALLGHSSYSMTLKYTHITEMYMDHEIEKANCIFERFH